MIIDIGGQLYCSIFPFNRGLVGRVVSEYTLEISVNVALTYTGIN